jgi:eukaryotic-like serine/threonine-protein kinase
MDEQRILDRYRLIERLASGGSAEVWRAHDEQLDRPVAVKRLHAHLLPDEASRRRLAAEARAAAGLSHPGIVGVYDVDVEGESPALVMELVEGESLAARIARAGPLQAGEAAHVAAAVADALFHAHQQGVIHRDVKPGNVLLERDGRVRLVDFGIAHSLAESAERLTLTGTVIGTLRSMAPEQLAAGPITPRADLYGLGVVLYEALTGRAPYPSSTPLVLAEAQRSGAPPLDGVDPALADLVTACLAHDPEHRPRHAGAVAEALRAWLGGAETAAVKAGSVAAVHGAALDRSDEPTLGGPAPSTEPATAAGPAPTPAAGPEPSRRASRQRRRAGVALLPLLLGAVAIGIGAIALLVGFNGTGDGVVGDRSPIPSPTPLPAWASELAADVAAACPAGTEPSLAQDLAAMGEDAAEAHADALIEACEDPGEDRDQEGNQGRGRGNGGNSGNPGGGNPGGGNSGNAGGGNSGNSGNPGRGNDR